MSRPDEQQTDEQVVTMWTPFSASVDKDYDFTPDGPLFRILHPFLRGLVFYVAYPFFAIHDRIQVHGAQYLKGLSGGAVTVCNHVHFFDCVFLARCCRSHDAYFLSLKSNFEIPIVRHLIRGLGALPIPEDRGGMMAFRRGIKTHLAQGHFIHVYPEGVLHPYYNGVRAFRRGAFTFACESGVPVLPFVITYRPRTGISRLWNDKPYLTINILPPIWPDPAKGRRAATEELEEKVQAAMVACAKSQNSWLHIPPSK